MADEAVSPPAPTAAPNTGAAVSSPQSSAAPDGGAAAVQPSSATPTKADTPVSPAGLTKQDVRTGLMDVAKAALTKTRSGKPSAQSDPSSGKGSAVAAPPAKTTEAAPSPGKTTEAKSADAASAPKDPNAVKEPGDGADPATDDDDAKLPFNDHPRWKKITGDLHVATERIKELQPDAEQYRKVTAYMDTFGLSSQDVAAAYDITAKLKNNPQLAYEALKPIWDELCNRVGVTLPEDLAKRVKEGFLDEASARELARQRAMTRTAEQEAVRFANATQRQEATRQHQAVQGAVARWDAQQVAKNPDFNRLRPFVEDAARSIMAKEGIAKTPDAAVAILDKAFKHVTERLQPLRPQGLNGSTPRQPVAGAVSTGLAAPEPKSLMEAAKLGLEGRYRPVN